MCNTIKTFVLATALATGGAGLAMAQAVSIDAAQGAPDTVRNPNAHLLYGSEQGATISESGRSSGYRGNAMLGDFNAPYAAGHDQSDLGAY
jgi:hypothetical protein